MPPSPPFSLFDADDFIYYTRSRPRATLVVVVTLSASLEAVIDEDIIVRR